MPTAVLVPMDTSAPSKAALRHAFLAHPDAEITVLHVVGISDVTVFGGVADLSGVEEGVEKRAAEVFSDATAIAGEFESEVATATDRGTVPRSIIDYVDEHDIEHIVIGSHGRAGVSRLLLGSVAEQVVRRAPVPVTVVR